MIVGIIVLLVACYVVYFFASAKARRERTIEGLIRVMLARGRRDATFTDVYFDAARRYAIEKGDEHPEPDTASADVLIDGRRWFVTFSRNPVGRGTLVSVLDSDKMTREAEDFALGPYRTGHWERVETPAEFVQAYFTEVDTNHGGDVEKLPKYPSWARSEQAGTDFATHVVEHCMRTGIAESYLLVWLWRKGARRILFSCVAMAERRGHALEFQQEVAIAFVKRAWDQLDFWEQEDARNLSLDGVDLEPIKAALNQDEDADA